MIEEEVISQESVQEPPYKKKVFDILSSNFDDFKLGEQDFYKKLATDKTYASKVHDVLIQNFSDFKKPKNEFIDSLTFEEPLKKKDGGEVSFPTKLPSKSQEYLDKGQGLVDNSFLKQIGQPDPSQLVSQYKSPDISLTQKPKKDYYDTKLEKGLVFDKEGELYTPSSEALSKPITKAEEASLKKSTQKDLVEQAREMPIQEPTKEGEWANVVQNVAANFELAGTKLAQGTATIVRDLSSLGIDNPDLYDAEGRKTKYTESASWMNDPLGKVILGLEGNKHRMQDVIKNNPLPSTFWGNAVSEVASFAPDIAATALLPEAKLAEGASVLKVIGANLINNFTKYMTVKGGVEGYGEARVSGKNIGKSVVEGGKGAVTGFQTGIEMAVLGAGSNLATKKIMQKAEKIGLTGVKGLTAKELVNLGTDVTAFGLLSPTAHAALEGRWVTAEEIASGTGIAALFRLKGAVENIKSNRELNKSLQETQELKQGVAISNFVDADPAAIERVYYTKESADELQLKALEAAKNAKETTDLQKKQQYIAEVMAYSKAANVKQVTEDIINNKDALRKFQESDLPDNIKQAFLEKAGEIIKQLDPLEQKKTLLGQDIVDTNNFIKESTEALNIESDPVKKMELQVSIEDAEKLLKDNEIELKKIIKEQNQPKQEEDLLTEDGIKNAQKEFNKNIDQQIKDLDKNNPDYKDELEALNNKKESQNEHYDTLLNIKAPETDEITRPLVEEEITIEEPTEINGLKVVKKIDEDIYQVEPQKLPASGGGEAFFTKYYTSDGREVLVSEEMLKKAEEVKPTKVKAEVEPSIQTDIKTQIEDFGVPKEDVEPVNTMLSNIYESLKKSGLTATNTLSEWVGIGRGTKEKGALFQPTIYGKSGIIKRPSFDKASADKAIKSGRVKVISPKKSLEDLTFAITHWDDLFVGDIFHNDKKIGSFDGGVFYPLNGGEKGKMGASVNPQSAGAFATQSNRSLFKNNGIKLPESFDEGTFVIEKGSNKNEWILTNKAGEKVTVNLPDNPKPGVVVIGKGDNLKHKSSLSAKVGFVNTLLSYAKGKEGYDGLINAIKSVYSIGNTRNADSVIDLFNNYLKSGRMADGQTMSEAKTSYENFRAALIKDANPIITSMMRDMGYTEAEYFDGTQLKKGIYKATGKGIDKMFADLGQEDFLKGLKTGDAYAALKVTSPVFFEKDLSHPSYPFAIKTIDSSPVNIDIFNKTFRTFGENQGIEGRLPKEGQTVTEGFGVTTTTKPSFKIKQDIDLSHPSSIDLSGALGQYESVQRTQSLKQKANAQYRIESGKNIIEALREFNKAKDKGKAVVAITHEIMHPTVVEIISGAKDGNEIGKKHTQTIVDEFNKATGNKITVDELINGNDEFKGGKTTKQYRDVQEFIAESWEKYHTQGAKGFSAEFQKVLETITEAFKTVYKSLTGKELTPELRRMFDDILGKSEFKSEYEKQLLSEGKSKKRQENARKTIIDSNFDQIVKDLIRNNKIEKIC